MFVVGPSEETTIIIIPLTARPIRETTSREDMSVLRLMDRNFKEGNTVILTAERALVDRREAAPSTNIEAIQAAAIGMRGPRHLHSRVQRHRLAGVAQVYPSVPV
jgi:hypothetical protein